MNREQELERLRTFEKLARRLRQHEKAYVRSGSPVDRNRVHLMRNELDQVLEALERDRRKRCRCSTC